jgi:hypothetical protein
MAAEDITSKVTDKWIFHKETVRLLLFVLYLIREIFYGIMASVYLLHQASFEH